MHLAHEVRTVEESVQKSSAEDGLAHEDPIKLRRLNVSMAIDAITLSQTSTYQLITH